MADILLQDQFASASTIGDISIISQHNINVISPIITFEMGMLTRSTAIKVNRVRHREISIDQSQEFVGAHILMRTCKF